MLADVVDIWLPNFKYMDNTAELSAVQKKDIPEYCLRRDFDKKYSDYGNVILKL